MGRPRKNPEGEKPPMSTGFGESKVFGGTNEPSPLLDCHVAGKLVREMLETMNEADGALWLSRLSYHQTDEGFEDRNRDRSELRVSVTSDPLAKAMQRKKDDVLDREMETWEATDPMREVLDRHARPGFRNRFLAQKVVDHRGLRGWQPVISENGDPVKLGGMVLAEMPEGKANARNAAMREAGNKRLEQVQSEYAKQSQGSAVADQ